MSDCASYETPRGRGRTSDHRNLPRTECCLPGFAASLSRVLRDAQEIRGQTGELQFESEIRCAEYLDHFLKKVAALPADAHEIALNRRLDLDLAVLDRLHDLSAFFDGYAGLNRNLLPCCSAGGRRDRSIRKVLQRNFAFGELLLKDIDYSLEFEIIDALNNKFLVLLVQIDLRLRILQIKSRLNLLPGLLNCIQHLGHIDNRYHIKAIVRHEDSIYIPLLAEEGWMRRAKRWRRRGGQSGEAFRPT